MAESDFATLLASVSQWVERKSAELGGAATDISPQTDLLGEGLLDSLAFIELIAYIEELTCRQIDLLEIDPDAFSTVEGLCGFILAGQTDAEAELVG